MTKKTNFHPILKDVRTVVVIHEGEPFIAICSGGTGRELIRLTMNKAMRLVENISQEIKMCQKLFSQDQ